MKKEAERSLKEILEEIQIFEKEIIAGFITIFQKLNLTKNEFRKLYKDVLYVEGQNKDEVVIPEATSLLKLLTGINHNLRKYVCIYFSLNKDLLEELFSEEYYSYQESGSNINIEKCRKELCSSGIVPSFEVYDLMALSKSKICSRVGVEYCSLEVLRKLIKHPCGKVRSSAYIRVGAKEAAKHMLSDSVLENRRKGILVTPVKSELLSDLINEPTLGVLNELVKKCDNETIFLLLGHKESKNISFKNLINFRMHEM